MSYVLREPAAPVEEFLAELTHAAYNVVLRHGLNAAFVDVELTLWAALRKVVERELYLTERMPLNLQLNLVAPEEGRLC
jgi:hypothetical protein